MEHITTQDLNEFRTQFYPFLTLGDAENIASEFQEDVEYCDNEQLLDDLEHFVREQDAGWQLYVKMLRIELLSRMS